MTRAIPRISVGMPVYNGEPYLEEAICCVLRQTYGDFELLISDNASTDKTEQICRDYAEQDSRIKYMRNEQNIGAAGNYNRVFQRATAPYFRWFNADDLCSPELHEKCIAVLDNNLDAALCYGKTTIIDQDGKTIEHYEDRLDLQYDQPAQRFMHFFNFGGLTNVIYGLMRTSAVAKTSLMGRGQFDGADINFMAELTLHGKFIELSLPLFYRRVHEKAMSWDNGSSDKQRVFWTANEKKYTLPKWKQNFALMKAVWRAPITKNEKIQLIQYVLRNMRWQREVLLEDLRNEFRHRFRRKASMPYNP